jgi:AcrR family transcriptional regulator
MTEQIDGRTLRYQHRRGELLEAVGEYVLDNGIASLSLRRVAHDVGVSHATLQHHFGSKEELIDEIVDHLLMRTLVPTDPREAPERLADPERRLRDMWAQWTSPVGRRDIRLFFEIVGQSLFAEAEYGVAMKRSIEARTDMMADWIVAQGCPIDQAPAVATLLIAELRGLMSDLLVTGDEERVAAAFEIVLDNSRRRIADWNRNGSANGARNGA